LSLPEYFLDLLRCSGLHPCDHQALSGNVAHG
jgi:hypothetical protein